MREHRAFVPTNSPLRVCLSVFCFRPWPASCRHGPRRVALDDGRGALRAPVTVAEGTSWEGSSKKQHGRPELNISFETYLGSFYPFPVVFTCVAVLLAPSYLSLLVLRSGQHRGEHGHE